jgi:hypothetical protein
MSNHWNPKGSTGPTSPEGKAASSKNALKHGSCSFSTLILKNESIEDFRALERRWFRGYGVNPDHPENEYEAELIKTAARADWFYQRADRNYAEVEARLMNDAEDLVNWPADFHACIARFQRYRTTNANLLAKHRKALEDYRKNRRAEAKAKVQTQPKPKPEPKQETTWAEHLAGMRRQAIELGYVNPDGTPTGKK